MDCDEEAAVCSDTIPVFNVVQKHGCYCRSQNTNAGITTCDGKIVNDKDAKYCHYLVLCSDGPQSLSLMEIKCYKSPH